MAHEKDATVGGWVALLRLLMHYDLAWETYRVNAGEHLILVSRTMEVLRDLRPWTRVYGGIIRFPPGSGALCLTTRAADGTPYEDPVLEFEHPHGSDYGPYQWFMQNAHIIRNVLVYGKTAPSMCDKIVFHLAPTRYWRNLFQHTFSSETAQ